VIRESVPTLAGNYLDYFEGVYEAVRNGAIPPVTGRDGVHIIQIIEAAFKSSEEKRVITLS
jgi:predicted dehydrogenase